MFYEPLKTKLSDKEIKIEILYNPFIFHKRYTDNFHGGIIERKIKLNIK